MANFWDLPKPIREKIYRLHLVHDGPLTAAEHDKNVKVAGYRLMPPICEIGPQAEREAAPIYYGENHFEFYAKSGFSGVLAFGGRTSLRHMRLIRKVSYNWPDSCAYYGFLEIAKMTQLEELIIGVDERQMVRSALNPRHNMQNYCIVEPSPQQQLAILRHPGMTGLHKISGIRDVQFVKTRNWKDDLVGGSIPGGILETQIKPKLMAPKSRKTKVESTDTSIPFLSLPPELRNRIYNLLLNVDGPVHPSAKPPSSKSKSKRSKTSNLAIESALNILAVNRQIHDEALGIFYHSNNLEFYYPTQLHAFLLSLGLQRQSFIRDITLHYFNNKCGGVDLIDLTFPLLKQLTGLRKFHILFKGGLTRRLSSWYWGSMSRRYSIHNANPMTLPGIKFLFTLRGITDIRIYDVELDSEMERLRKEREYPNSAEGTKDYSHLQLSRVLAHLNSALADAQRGKVNKGILNDDEWHLRDVFPTLDRD